MYHILEQIQKPNDIKNIAPEDYRKLAAEIRSCLVNNVSRTGGHLASNLGVVELTMALHLCLDFPEDKIVWDVGHQSYVHKILTGRWKELGTIRQYEGLSGFPQVEEDETDTFDTGHASTSVSAALGFAHASKIMGKNNKVFAVIGDGSMTGGMFYEAINNAAALKSNMIIILNDNNMSISKNVGGMSRYLTKLRMASQYNSLKGNVEEALKKMPYIGNEVLDTLKRSKSSLKHLFIPGMFFEDMGLVYFGPIDGHNINDLVTAINQATKIDKPVVVHVKTKKGKGYRLAEEKPCMFHGIEPFIVKTGEPRYKKEVKIPSYTEIFGKKMCSMAKENEKIVAVCAAMPLGTGLAEFSEEYKDRFFDVGIAEEHAVTFAAGLASEGLVPVVALYSTFLQRAYDQIIHDVCKTGKHVVFAIDRGGLVGADGETHQGIYDISFLSSIPNLTIMAPKNASEFEEMLEYAVNEYDGPVCVRYPRGEACESMAEYNEKIVHGKAEVISGKAEGGKVLMLAYGTMVEKAAEVANELENRGISSSVVNLRFAKPLDTVLLSELVSKHEIIVTLEENTINGGISQQIAAYMQWSDYSHKKSIAISLPDKFIEHGKPDILKEKYGLGKEYILDKITKLLSSQE